MLGSMHGCNFKLRTIQQWGLLAQTLDHFVMKAYWYLPAEGSEGYAFAFSLMGEFIAIARLCNGRNRDTCFFAGG